MISFFMAEKPVDLTHTKELDSEWDSSPILNPDKPQPPKGRIIAEGEIIKKPRKRRSAIQKKLERKVYVWKMASLLMAMAMVVLVIIISIVTNDAGQYESKLNKEIREHGKNVLYQARLVEERNFEISALKEKLSSKSDIKILTKINRHIELLEPSLDPNVRMIISKAIEKWCNKYTLSYSLVTNLIYAETLPKFNIFSKSPKDCIGLMQINFDVHKKNIEEMKDMKVEDLYHIDTNVKFGCMILRGYIDKSNNPTAALRKYVGGADLKYIRLIYEKMALWEVNNYEKTNEVEEGEENVLREVRQTDVSKDSIK